MNLARRPFRALLLLGAALSVVFPWRAAAYSVLLNPPSGWNGFFLRGSLVTGFRESGGPGLLLTTNTATLLVAPDFPAPFPGASYSNSVAFTNYPGSGLAKDMAGGALDFWYTVGGYEASSYDSFDFRIRGTNSASNAMVDFGSGLVAADGVVEVDFALQSAWPLTTAFGAAFGLPAMTNLTAPSPPNIESMIAVATVGPFGSPTTTYTRHPGDPELVIPLELAENEFFQYELAYSLVTPYGEDPGVDYSFSGSAATAVPEPSTAALLCLAPAAGWFLLRRRR